MHFRWALRFRFRQSKWSIAEQHYSEALSGALHISKRGSLVPTLYRNRSGARFALKRFDEALADATVSLQLEPSNSKVIFHSSLDSFLTATIQVSSPLPV